MSQSSSVTSSAAMGRAPRLGVIIGSTRKPRACSEITDFVVDTIQTTVLARLSSQPQPAEATTVNDSTPLAASSAPPPTLYIIDLAERNLPLFDESGVPSTIQDPRDYDHEHTRAWSAEISSLDGFVFVSPQYNWGYPAALKNAIDYLFNEWKGKPAMIVTYGGHGGNKCGAQLHQVLQGVRMLPCEKRVELAFPSNDVLKLAATGKKLGLDGTVAGGMWGGKERDEIELAFLQLMDAVAARFTRAPQK